jgi:hypothetical protein
VDDAKLLNTEDAKITEKAVNEDCLVGRDEESKNIYIRNKTRQNGLKGHGMSE